MTLTLELGPDLERVLEAEALRAGVPMPQYARQMLAEALSEQQQDLEDVEEARQILASSEPSQRRTLDDLRKALGR